MTNFETIKRLKEIKRSYKGLDALALFRAIEAIETLMNVDECGGCVETDCVNCSRNGLVYDKYISFDKED